MWSNRQVKFYHYTCSHRMKEITRRGMLRPHASPALEGRCVLWLTDMEVPDREALGLTSHLLPCDRLEHRYVVEADEAVPWSVWIEQHAIPTYQRRRLENDPARRPQHWFVIERSVLGILDRSYRFVPEMAHEGAVR